jgi:hypothetical protein
MSHILVSNVPETTVSATTIPVTGIDAAQYSALQGTSNDGSKYTNTGSPIGYPMTVAIKQRIVQNVYSGTKVPVALQLPYKNGINLHVKLNETWSIVPDDESSSTCCDAQSYDLPASVSLTITVPNHPLVTEQAVTKLVSDVLGYIYNLNGSNKLGAYLRGATSL